MVKLIKSFVITTSVLALILSLSTALWGGTTGKIAGRIVDAPVIHGQRNVLIAEREIVKMDESASVINASADEIVNIPMVSDMSQYINLQAGIEGEIIRGGDLDQTAFMVDGLMLVDNRANVPVMAVNLSSIKELNIIMGGFNAEYGNVRSGLINVVTKEGDPTRFHGSVDFRYTPAQLKHKGASLFDPENWYLARFLDDDVAMGGTVAGTWTDYEKNQVPSFKGWTKIAEEQQDKYPGITAQQCQDIFRWQHTVEGSEALGQEERTYGDEPDMVYDLSLGGPVPIIGGFLGDMSFFVSHRTNKELFALPVSREYYTESNTQFKLTSRVTPSIKLHIEGSTGLVESVNQRVQGSDGEDNLYVRGGDGILWSTLAGGYNIDDRNSYKQHGSGDLYWPKALTPFDIHRNTVGLALDHVLSPRTFYNVRVSYVSVVNDNGRYLDPDKPPPIDQVKLETGPDYRSDDLVETIGGWGLTEEPYGMDKTVPPLKMLGDGMFYSATGGGAQDSGKVNTVNIKIDLTSQVNKYNQVKTGVEFVYDDLYTLFRHERYESSWENRETRWEESPYRVGAYIQDKLEFEGMVANFGLRLDYNQPNTSWFDIEEPYSDYYRPKYKDAFRDDAPQKSAEGQLKISPRLGISHPISESAKLYFNYGHFYSMPPSEDMYRIFWGKKSDGVRFIGNPNAELPRTVAYELGVDFNVAGIFRARFGGYYKDVGDQTGDVNYEGYDGGVDYGTIENNHYEDIRGFELRIDKAFGRWVTGWLNYNYMVSTKGFIGREDYFEDQREQRKAGLQDPYQEIPLARPRANGQIILTTPGDFGPVVGGMNILGEISTSLLWSWKAGEYITWDPLDTYELKDNLQWKGKHSLNARIQKRARIGGQRLTLFVDINNILDLEYIDEAGFSRSSDREKYYKTLRLPMYDSDDYIGERDVAKNYFIGGDDKLGDLGGPGTDKEYIDMPDRYFLTFLNPRTIIVGLKFDF